MPRQSGLVKISKLGMLRPRPPSQLALLAERDRQVDVLALDVDALDVEVVQPPARLVEPLAHLAPARHGILLVEEARVHDLLPVLLQLHARLGRHRRVCRTGPASS